MAVSMSGRRRLARVLELIGEPVESEMRTLLRGLRFVLAGGGVAVYYLTATIVLADVVGLPFEVALAIGYSTAIALHFMLQRTFVWVHREAFALPVHHQLLRYLVVVGAQYGITAGVTATIPGALHVPIEPVYLVTAAALAATNFLVMGGRVFHREDRWGDQPARDTLSQAARGDAGI